MRANGAGTMGFSGLIAQPTKAAQLRGLNERGVFADDGSRMAGFGFGADGSKATLRDFLADSHCFDGIIGQDKSALESFLLSFPTETPPVVGLTRIVDASNCAEASIHSDLALMVKQAELGNCSILVTGLLQGEQIDLVYDRDNKSFRSRVDSAYEMELERLLSSIGYSESFVSFVATPMSVGD